MKSISNIITGKIIQRKIVHLISFKMKQISNMIVIVHFWLQTFLNVLQIFTDVNDVNYQNIAVNF